MAQGGLAKATQQQGNQNGGGKLSQFHGFLTKHKDQISMALPEHMNADRMIRLTLTTFSQNPALLDCTPQSVMGSIITASQMGLEIGVNGQGFLVPYNNRKKNIKEAQFIPGWKGMVDLVNRSGRATVWTGAVFKGDDFDYAYGDSPFIRHRPEGDETPENLLYTYAVGQVNGAQKAVIEVWPAKKIWRHRDANNKVGQRHYSYEHPVAYAKKLPLLRVIDFMPQSISLQNAIAATNALESGRGITMDGDFITVDSSADYDESTDISVQQPRESGESQKTKTFAEVAEAIKKKPGHALDYVDQSEKGA